MVLTEAVCFSQNVGQVLLICTLWIQLQMIKKVKHFNIVFHALIMAILRYKKIFSQNHIVGLLL